MKIFSTVVLFLALSVSASAGAKPFMLVSKAVTHATGTVSKIGKSGLCMDGATHSLHTQNDNLRLKAGNDGIAHQLKQAASSGNFVAITGHKVLGPECSYVRVDSIGPLHGAHHRKSR